MGSIVDGAMAVFGIVAGLMLVIGTLKASESPADLTYRTAKTEDELKTAA